jgi:hypothetical protein
MRGWKRSAPLVLAMIPTLALAWPGGEKSTQWAKELDKATVRQAVQDHEADPLSRESRSTLAPMLLAHFEDMSYVVCLDQVPGLEDEGALGKALLWQMSFGSGAYLEQHPEKAGNREAYMLAGLQSAVRAYRNVRAKSPKKTIALFEELDVMERGGRLQQHVRAHSCGKKN